MADTQSPSGKTWRYRFSKPGDVEIEVQEFMSDEDALAYARELSKGQETPVVVGRHDSIDWEYLTEVDERS